MAVVVFLVVLGLLFAYVVWAIWNDNFGWHWCRYCHTLDRHPKVEGGLHYFTYRCRACGLRFHV